MKYINQAYIGGELHIHLAAIVFSRDNLDTHNCVFWNSFLSHTVVALSIAFLTKLNHVYKRSAVLHA